MPFCVQFMIGSGSPTALQGNTIVDPTGTELSAGFSLNPRIPEIKSSCMEY